MKPPIYFICTENKEPIGGIKQLYRQVDILNKNGFEAYIVHRKRGFRHKWFENSTRIIYNIRIFAEIDHKIIKKKVKFFKNLKNLYRSKKDDKFDPNGILVFPEIFGPFINSVYSTHKKVVFNQNCFYTFNNCKTSNNPVDSIYLNDNYLGSIVVSENSKNYLNFVYPQSKTQRIFLGIDNLKFKFSKENKKKQIAFMPRKLEDDIIQIVNILKQRGNLTGWDFVEIHKKSENEVASILNESAIFLSLNHREGFGLPPAEAMASGCMVVGYTGQGGDEYFNPEFSVKINEGNILNFVTEVEKIALDYDLNKSKYNAMSEAASNFIKSTYSMENEEKSIIHVWNEILKNE